MRLLRRTLALTLLSGLLWAPAASAADGPAVQIYAVGSQGMASAQQIAAAYWATTPCNGDVTVGWRVLAPRVNAISTWWAEDLASPTTFSRCTVDFNANRDLGWEEFCTVMVHEYGHLLGHEHSGDPRNLMAPIYAAPVAPCIGTEPGVAPAPPVVAPTAPAAQPATKKARPARVRPQRKSSKRAAAALHSHHGHH